MKKLLSVILSVTLLCMSAITAFAQEAANAGAEPAYVTKKVLIPEQLKDESEWDISARYTDSGEAITLSYGFDGYIYATVPAENKDREIEAFVPQAREFSDCTNDVYGDFHSFMELSKTGVITGNENGEAKPKDNITRAECTAMIMRFLGLENMPRLDKTTGFDDVNKNDWFYSAVTSAYNCKIVEGDSQTQFYPDRNVTREEVVTMIARALKYAGLNCSASWGDCTYQDFDLVSPWAKEAYTFLRSNVPMDMISGTETETYVDLRPQDAALRLDVADTLNPLWRMCQTYPRDLAEKYGFDKEMPVIDGSTSTYPFTQAVYSKLFYNGANQKAYPKSHSKSHVSYQRLINGEVDMLFASVYPASDILEMAKEKGVELELIPIAYDAMIFFTNAQNPALNLTKEQITDIYVNDKYTNWSELGGPDALLYPYCRNNDSGSHAQMERHFLNGKDIHPEVQKETSTAMADILTDVMAAKTDNPAGYGLGYSIYYYFHNMNMFYGTNTHLKLLSIDGVQPTDETIADGTYPLSNNTYVVLRKDTPDDAPARKMAEFMLTEEGQACVREAGYGSLK